MAHPRPSFMRRGNVKAEERHKHGPIVPAMQTYKALPSMRYTRRNNIDLTRPRFTKVAPIQRAPSARYKQLNPSVREGHVMIDWTGRNGGQVPRTVSGGLRQRNSMIKSTNRPVA